MCILYMMDHNFEIQVQSENKPKRECEEVLFKQIQKRYLFMEKQSRDYRKQNNFEGYNYGKRSQFNSKTISPSLSKIQVQT